MINKQYIHAVLSILIGFLLFLFSMDFGMFWDNVLFASKMGNHLYFNDIFNWTMPDSFDPGHPPFLGFLLAIVWRIFGPSLWISHLVMLPFIAGVIYQLHRFVNYYVKNDLIAYFGVFLILSDPTLATSFVLVNPEVIILFFFFLALNGILLKQKYWKFIGLIFLSIITFRSMMLFAGLFLFDILNTYFFNQKSLKKIVNQKFLLTYFLASVPGVAFVLWRLTTKGWLQTHPDSPWANYWHFASLKEFAKNIAILIHRYIDFGRVFVFLFLIIVLILSRKKIKEKRSVNQLFLLAVTSVFFVIITVLLSTNAFGHRYFIVSYICFILAAFLIIQGLKKYKTLLWAMLFVGLISGNLWVYPRETSQGWDATLAHVPYHSLRQDAITFLDNEKIAITEVASFFPNNNKIDYIDLSGDNRSFTNYNGKNKYIFYSNVYNLSDEEYKTIDEKYVLIKKFEKFNIIVSILKLKDF